VRVGDTLFYSEGFMRLDTVIGNPHNDKYNFTSSDTAIMAKLSVVTSDSMKLTARPVYFIKDDQLRDIPDTLFAAGLVVAFRKIKSQGLVEISVKESSQLAPLIALKVLQFPFINLVWIGTLVMLAGIVMSIIRRVRLL
jgi:cytochrome c-type biogenesis protein CcmF